ncbi:mechanosensitive ion channel [Nitrosopumilus sp. K4]|uniref:mechanosensitive ion channel domain-containing protein n=1 Tax=Nitrosopumilus sp. K4 TaxID=2795383 RepID=UPI001BA8A750|nr:mechanosensitive ion channel domain-containing protein [Nitrosopumilus sp. K4]QUC64087.1 mechanosensitive ion channel [Nitrosopumilus sp. K4]
MEANIIYAIISILITASIFIIIKIVEFTKFRTLLGSGKATGVIFIIIAIAEVMYLAVTLKMLSPAIEVVTSLSAILLFFTFVYLNKLQNAISGMSIALGRRINVGSDIEFEGKHGKIIQIGLTKTMVELNDSRVMLIPNKKFDEEVSIISNSKIQKVST